MSNQQIQSIINLINSKKITKKIIRDIDYYCANKPNYLDDPKKRKYLHILKREIESNILPIFNKFERANDELFSMRSESDCYHTSIIIILMNCYVNHFRFRVCEVCNNVYDSNILKKGSIHCSNPVKQNNHQKKYD